MENDGLSKIDVILPFHRIDDFLIQSVNSICAQSHVKVNLILVDDRVNATPEFKLSNLEYVVVYSGGIGYRRALQLGVLRSENRYLAFQDSDDVSSSNRLSIQLRKLRDENLAVVGCKMGRLDEKGRFLIPSPQLKGEIKNSQPLLLGSQAANSTWLIDSSKFDKDHWSLLQSASPDWELAFSVFGKHKVFIINEYLYFYRQHQDQLTRNIEYETRHFQDMYPIWRRTCESIGIPVLQLEEAWLFATGRASYVRLSSKIYTWSLRLIGMKNITSLLRWQLLVVVSFRLARNQFRKPSWLNMLVAIPWLIILGVWYFLDILKTPMYYLRVLGGQRIV
jgi:glycosyltransferase involved in cell wall biosynthesis